MPGWFAYCCELWKRITIRMVLMVIGVKCDDAGYYDDRGVIVMN